MKTIFLAILLPLSSLASTANICGEDNRVPVSDPKIGRLGYDKMAPGCTVTMISSRCAITAGHCVSVMDRPVEFNVPVSYFGRLDRSKDIDLYDVDREEVWSRDYEPEQDDWAIVRLKANAITGKYPGDVNGFYPVSFVAPKEGEKIFLSGYGLDMRGEGHQNGILQKDTSTILEVLENRFSYHADSMPGNSGSAIIRVKEQDIVGIHTLGFQCTSITGNEATMLAGNDGLKRAIVQCLKND